MKTTHAHSRMYQSSGNGRQLLPYYNVVGPGFLGCLPNVRIGTEKEKNHIGGIGLLSRKQFDAGDESTNGVSSAHKYIKEKQKTKKQNKKNCLM